MGVLGPVFGFTDDDLVRLRAQSAALQKEQNAGNAGKPARMSLYGALLLARQGPAEDPFTQKVNDFYDKLTALRQMARSVPAEQLLEEIFATTGYLAALGVTENGARRREDARRFASFCAASGAGGISALVRAIDAAALAGSTGQDTTPGGARPGCVTVMTIHRSKGLQFPVVFVADTARRFNAADTRQPVLLHRMYGAGLRLRPEEGEGAYKTAAYTALSNVHAAEMRSEQMRLLYVALTRAQDKLILTVPLGIGKTSNPFARAAAFLEAGAGQTLCRQANSFADWLRAALLVHPNGGPLRRLAEDLETVRNCWLSEYYQTRLHMCHVSTRGALEAIQMAKLRGAPVTCEVTPHHLWFNNETCDYRVNPPIRTADDVQALIDGIRSGVVDAIATDHAPHSEEDKLKGMAGMVGSETAFGVCYTKLCREEGLPLELLVHLMSTRPAEILGLAKGQLEPGYDADFVLVDLDTPYTVDKEKLHSKSHNCPFDGAQLYGRVYATIKGGKLTYQAEE